MFRSFRTNLATRFFVIGILAVLMILPLMAVSSIVSDRKKLQNNVRYEIGRVFGGEQIVRTPVLIVPIKKTRSYTVRVQGQPEAEHTDVSFEFFHLPPEGVRISGSLEAEYRHRGIFKAPIYAAGLDMTAQFDVSGLEDLLEENEVLLPDEAELYFGISRSNGILGDTALKVDGAALPLENTTLNGTLKAALSRAQLSAPIDITLSFTGANRLYFAPYADRFVLTLTSNWPDPSFEGSFLPKGHDVSAEGFTADWDVSGFAINAALKRSGKATPPVLSETGSKFSNAFNTDGKLGLDLIETADFYQMAYRISRYSVLLIGLSFLSVLLLERRDAPPTHPVQYLLIGLSQCVFVLLMVALAEQLGFLPAYAVASLATITLIALFSYTALGFGRHAIWAFLILGVLYAVIYLILRSTDYALLGGSILSFAAVAATMFFTQKLNWYSPEPATPTENSNASASVPSEAQS